MLIDGYAALTAKAALQPHHYPPAELAGHDVLIKISHCGICHSDIHLIDNDWHVSSYPLVPGHEIIGEVVAVGTQVTGLRTGIRVGVGWQAGSCGSCAQCRGGHEQLCAQNMATCVGRPGGFATYVIAQDKFAVPIPATLASDVAAPLLCAGITVFSPLARYQVGPGVRVGVVGIGGLGHLAVQFAHQMGAHVTAFSTTANKQDEAHRLGADHFVLTRAADAMAHAAGSCDLILTTASVDVDWEAFVKVLAPLGTLCVLGAAPHPVAVGAFGLIGGNKSISGSAIGDPATIARMLEVAANHGVAPQIERFAMRDVNTALTKVRANAVRYRAVLAN